MIILNCCENICNIWDFLNRRKLNKKCYLRGGSVVVVVVVVVTMVVLVVLGRLRFGHGGVGKLSVWS